MYITDFRGNKLKYFYCRFECLLGSACKIKMQSEHLNKNWNKDRNHNIAENMITSSGISLVDKVLMEG